MATIDDFLGWVREDLGIEADVLPSGSAVCLMETQQSRFTVHAFGPKQSLDAAIVLHHHKSGIGHVLYSGPLRYTTWTKCLAAIVANEMKLAEENKPAMEQELQDIGRAAIATFDEQHIAARAYNAYAKGKRASES